MHPDPVLHHTQFEDLLLDAGLVRQVHQPDPGVVLPTE